MAENTQDSYAGSRAGLRDAAKWYAAAISALGAAVAGSLSFGIIPDLGENHIQQGVIVGGGVLAIILAGIYIFTSVLFPRPFGAEKLDQAKYSKLVTPYLSQILPSGTANLADLKAQLATALAAHDDDEVDRLRLVSNEVTGLASFLDLTRNIRNANILLVVLFLVACTGLGYLSYLHGLAKAEAASGATVAVTFSPGTDWTGYAGLMTRTCGPDAKGSYAAKATQDKPFDGWWTLTLTGPGACGGVTLAVPGTLVLPVP